MIGAVVSGMYVSLYATPWGSRPTLAKINLRLWATFMDEETLTVWLDTALLMLAASS